MSNKPPAYCIFCGIRGVTKQHVWPDWMGTHLPRDDTFHTQLLTEIELINLPLLAVIRPKLHISKGPFAARKLRIACSACNSGWMSQLESQAKPILLQLMSGRVWNLSAVEQHALASWIVLFTVVAEFTDKKTIAIPPVDRITLRTQKMPPPGWRIWIALHDSRNWRHGFIHHALAVYQTTAIPTHPAPYNCQFTTIGIGSILFHAVRTPFDAGVLRFSDNIAAKLSQLWPINEFSLRIDSIKKLLDEETEAVSNEFALPLRS